jgi:hypothetical protein
MNVESRKVLHELMISLLVDRGERELLSSHRDSWQAN